MLPAAPLVSVCIPAYNSEKFAAETIRCILNQTHQHIEVIVVNDGSTDGTAVVLDQIQDPRFRYVSQPNKGAAAARNAAFQLSSGSFIKFMDADDLINENCIQNQLQRIIAEPGSIASAKWGRFYSNDGTDFKLAIEKVWKDLPGIDWLVNSLIDTGANMMQPGIFLIPRAIIEKAGAWNESLSLIDDFDYMVRVLAASEKVLFCDGAILKYRSGVSNNLSGKNSPVHMLSAFSALNLGVENILKAKNDKRSRLACANTFKRWSYLFYPNYMDYYIAIENEIEQLGGSDISIVGSRSFNILAMLIGWKKAKKIKMYLTGNE